MYKSICSVKTDKASQYLRKLCKHFAHKVDVEYDDHKGVAFLPSGTANMIATDDEIVFKIQAESEKSLDIAIFVIEDHFIRFAFKENIQQLDWQKESC